MSETFGLFSQVSDSVPHGPHGSFFAALMYGTPLRKNTEEKYTIEFEVKKANTEL